MKPQEAPREAPAAAPVVADASATTDSGTTAAGATPAMDADGGTASAADVARLEEEVRQLKQRLLEAAADRDNQAKRFVRERQVVRDEITARVGREMIEVLDNLDLVLNSLPEADRNAPLAQGVTLTRVVFLEKLKSFGIEPMEPLQRPFDPYQHEALFAEERSDVAPGTVVGEITRGYRMGNQTVRAAKVRVAKAPSGAPPAAPGAATDSAPAVE